MKRQDLRNIFTKYNVEASEDLVKELLGAFHTEMDSNLETKEKEISKQYEGFISPEEVSKVKKQLEDETKKYNDYVASIETRDRTNAIESAIKDAKGRNTKAILALLDNEKITFKDGKLEGLNEQIEALQKSDAFLFGQAEENPKYSGGSQVDTPNNGGISMEALRNL